MRTQKEWQFGLLVLLVKLKLWPPYNYEGKIYPASITSHVYKDWFDGRR